MTNVQLKPCIERCNVVLVCTVLFSFQVVDVSEELVGFEPIRIVDGVMPVGCKRNMVLQRACISFKQLGKNIIKPLQVMVAAANKASDVNLSSVGESAHFKT